MTVQDLINELNKIKDKAIPVIIEASNGDEVEEVSLECDSDGEYVVLSEQMMPDSYVDRNELEARQMISGLSKLYSKALAWDEVSKRLSDALDYVQQNKVGVIGLNVWHVILDDAIRLRAEKNA